MEEFITVRQLEEHLKVSRITIYQWRKQGMPYMKINKSVRFRLSDVIAWIDEKQKNKVGW